MTNHVIENVRFRLEDGVTTEAFLAANKAVDSWLATLDGFVTRSLSEGEDGVWLDHVEWTDMAAAKAASEAMMTVEALAPFGKSIAAEGLEMRHHMLRYKA